MKKFVIITDSSCNLENELRDKYDIEYVPMYFNIAGREYEANLDWDIVSAPEFYNIMRNGERITTAQVNPSSYREAFEKAIIDGNDVLCIGCTSVLSSSIKSGFAAKEELAAKYPEAKIICIDSTKSSYALGLLCMRASQLRDEGKTIEEVAEWVEQNKNNVHQIGTVEKLTYLKQAGRVSAAAAFFGGLLNVKPIIIADVKGHNAAIEKVKGRKASFVRMGEIFAENYLPLDYQTIIICHSDCVDEAEEFKTEIESRLPEGEKPEIRVSYIGPIMGASTGPGTLAVYFFGKDITYSVD